MAKDKYYNKVENYVISIIHAQRMMNLGIIDADDFNKIDNKLRKKYCINFIKIISINYS